MRCLPLIALALSGCAAFPTWYADYEIEELKDRDEDGYIAAEWGGEDCDDTNASVHPGAEETWYDGTDQDCDGRDDDQDNDGFSANDDCDDTLATVNPDATEVCDDIDNDCDDLVDDEDDSLSADTWYLDDDGDGHGDPTTEVLACDAPSDDHVQLDDDCDDTEPDNYPGNDEVCDDIDNNCDGQVDIDLASDAGVTIIVDNDGDGYGDEGATPIQACSVPSGYADVGGDCNDGNKDVYPGAPEPCGQSTDFNCDGFGGDEDDDNDGYASCEDCDETDADINPGATEVCNSGVDDDCDGLADDEDDSTQAASKTTYYVDADTDTYGDPTTEQDWCTPPSDGNTYVTNGDDCDDTTGQVAPNVAEIVADGIDQDCTGDDLCHVDDDGDGFGLAATTEDTDQDLDCTTGDGVADNADDCNDTDEHTFPGAAPNDDASACLTDEDDDDWASTGSGGTDCDDINPDAYPGASETVDDGVDQDCDGDDLCYADSDGDGFGDPDTFVEDTDQDLSCATGTGVTTDSDDCDDSESFTFPGAAYEESNTDCMRDEDADGYGDAGASGDVVAGTDCNDEALAANPGNPFEYCGDTLDNDCDQSTDDSSGCIYDLANVDDTEISGTGAGRFGSTVLYAADPQGTGSAGLWVGAPDAGNGGAFYLFENLAPGSSLGTGNATVTLSGKTGEKLGGLAGGVVLDNDGDGVDDLAIVDSGTLSGPRVLVLEGPFADADASDEDVASISGSELADFATSMTAGRLNTDPQSDLIVGSPGSASLTGDTDAGAVHVFAGPNSGSLNAASASGEIVGDATDQRVGEALGVYDMDRNGTTNLLVTAEDGGGSVLAFTNPTASLGLSDADASIVGSSLDSPQVFGVGGDIDGDAEPDLLVGDPENAGFGKVWLFHDSIATTGAALSSANASIEATSAFGLGASVAFVPDLDNDENDEVLVGAPDFGGGDGAVFLFFGAADLGTLSIQDAQLRLEGAAASETGHSLAVGDLDGDALLDLAIGAPGAASDVGQVHLIFGDTF